MLEPSAVNGVISGVAALAGIVMISASRYTLLPGPLMALGLVPGTALVGCALVAGRFHLGVKALERLALDVALILVLAPLVVVTKQAAVHRRAPGVG